MKTTFDLPDELVIRAKKRAAELRIPLRNLVEEGLRQRLAPRPKQSVHPSKIRWVAVAGGLPDDLDLSSREKMHEWIKKRS